MDELDVEKEGEENLGILDPTSNTSRDGDTVFAARQVNSAR